MRMFENRVLRRMFGLKRDEATGEWRILHNEELNHLYCSPSIVRVMKSRRMRWAGHIACAGPDVDPQIPALKNLLFEYLINSKHYS